MYRCDRCRTAGDCVICRRKNCDRVVDVKTLRLCRRHYQQYRRRHGLMPTCSVEDCSQEVRGKRLCRTHLRYLRATGDPLIAPTPSRAEHPMRPCRVPACPNDASAIVGRGLCHTHSNRLSQGLDLMMPLTPGKRGRKPYVPGIPPHLRAAMVQMNRSSLAGRKPTRELLDLCAEYNRMITAWRLTRRPPERVLAELDVH